MNIFFRITAPRRPQGVSLIIAVLFTTIFLLITVGISQSVFFGLREIRDFARFDQLQYLAQGITHMLQRNADLHLNVDEGMGVGYEIRNTDIVCPRDNAEPELPSIFCGLAASALGNGVTADISYDIISRTSPDARLNFESAQWHSAPLAFVTRDSPSLHGTGTLQNNCDDLDNDPRTDDTSSAQNQCHWNIIVPGEIIEIPLFYDADSSPDGSSIVNVDSDGEPVALRLRIRTPSGLLAPTSPDDQRHWRRDPALISWQIISEDETLEANRDIDDSGIRTAQNSEIYATVINDARAAGNFTVLDEQALGNTSSGASDISISSFLNTLAPEERAYLRLQLNAIPKGEGWINRPARINNLEERRNELRYLITQLEYQFLINKPISDEKRITRSRVRVGDIVQTFEARGYLPLTTQTSSLEEL